MRGALSFIIGKVKIGVVLCALIAFSIGKVLPAHAAGDGLDLARDTVATPLPNIPNIYHAIYFVLPVDAQQITAVDWLLITLPNYRNVDSSGLFLSGAFGTPIVNQVGNEVLITNFSLLPGTGLSVNGIVATNPSAGEGTQVQLQIAQDQNATVVRNFVTLIPTNGVDAVSVSATIQTQTAALSISGYTAPTTFTTLTEGPSVIATTVSDNTGFFSFSSGGMIPGSHAFQIYSTDDQNRSSSQASLSLFLLTNTITTASGLLLSPGLSLDTDHIHAGDTLTITGSAKPNSQINIFLESPLRSYTASSNSSGNWSYTVPSSETSAMSPGSYRIYALTQDVSGNQSIFSPTLNFQVVTNDTSVNPDPACNISHGDLNCNGVTNLTDFSILLFHWNTNHKVADINKDGSVNLVDFSIMMFYYTS